MPRLDQLLARNLGRSRRQATGLLRAGRVRDPGGQVLSDPRLRIAADELPSLVEVDGRPLRLREHMHLLQHKPAGVVTSRKDPRHATAWELLEGAPLHGELRAVGRLDLDAAGLLLWTSEGPRIHALTHPRRAVAREYQVALAGRLAEAEIPRDDAGAIALTLGDGFRPRIRALERLAPAATHPALAQPEGTELLARIVVLDGVHHEVKRIFAALGTRVLSLLRTAHAGLRLPEELAAGEWRELDDLPRESAGAPSR